MPSSVTAGGDTASVMAGRSSLRMVPVALAVAMVVPDWLEMETVKSSSISTASSALTSIVSVREVWAEEKVRVPDGKALPRKSAPLAAVLETLQRAVLRPVTSPERETVKV